MVPLVGAMDHPRPLNRVRVGIMDDPHVNAASAGGGEFYVTCVRSGRREQPDSARRTRETGQILTQDVYVDEAGHRIALEEARV